MKKIDFLLQLLKDMDIDQEWQAAGIKAFIRLDIERVVEVSFAQSGTHGVWNSLLVAIIHKKRGEITRNVFALKDYGMDNYVWKTPSTCNKLEWYKRDRINPKQLQNAIKSWFTAYS